jgi:hypothetical protein
MMVEQMPTNRAINKKLTKHFHVGDRVTWGTKVQVCTVLKVTDKGVFVDGSASPYFVPFVSKQAYGAQIGPPVLVEKK